MKRGRAPTMTEDYQRNCTTTLFAAFNAPDLLGVIDEFVAHHNIRP